MNLYELKWPNKIQKDRKTKKGKTERQQDRQTDRKSECQEDRKTERFKNELQQILQPTLSISDIQNE